MRLLHVINSLDPHQGGTVEVVRSFTGEQVRQGLQVDVVTLETPGQSWFERIKAPVIALGPSKLGSYGYNNKLMTWMREHRDNYDAVILHGIWDYACLGGWRGLRGGRTPYFVYTHGMLSPWFERYKLKHLKKTMYWKRWAYQIMRDAAGVIFTTHHEEVLARSSFHPYEAKTIIAPLGTTRPDPSDIQYRDLFFNTYPQLRDKRLAVFIGRVHPTKGLDLLIAALGNLAASYPDFMLFITGPELATERKALEAQARELGVADRIVWAGVISEQLRAGARHSGGVFVLSSHTENFGLSIVESLAYGQPVVITDKVNIWREIYIHGAAIVGSDTVEETTAALKRYLDLPPGEFARMQQNAVRCFEECFHLPVVTRHLTDALQQRIAAPGAAVTA